MKLKKNPKVVTEKLDGEICIFNPENANYINLNFTGSKIWDLLDKTIDVEEIIRLLKSEYESENQIIENETKLFIKKCLENNLLISFKD